MRPLTRRAAFAALLVALPLAGWAADPFPEPSDSEKSKDKPLPPADAAKGFKVPPGFSVSVFAAEPDVRNPIGCAWDTRGRLWVAENFTYAERPVRFDARFRDRVLIFEDADGDGRPEKRTVFTDVAKPLTSVAVGRGGVWLMCPPRLLFVPDRDRDDMPDGPPEVVLDGFDVPPENYHNLANGLKWGPDGWLYGRCGASAPGRVRRPGEPPEAGIPLAGGVWRYHPTAKTFEPLCHGTTNPWGHDWDANGECFFVNTVNAHLWHLIPGAHLRRPHTISPNPLAYEPLEGHADHWHFDTGKSWNAARDAPGSSDALGGGHAHSGAMIYNGRQWPEAFRGKLLTLNFHGRRVNVERLERAGSGYVGRHEPDILFAADPFFRGIDLTTGPDGSVYVLDWSDTGECHENTGVHRSSGRVFRVTHGDAKPTAAPDLRKLDDEQLVALNRHGNEWYVRAAREEAASRPKLDEKAVLLGWVNDLSNGDPRIRLRAIWALHAIGKLADKRLHGLLDDPDEHIRVWAVRFVADGWPLDTVLGTPRAEGVTVPADLRERLARMAREDASGLVRLALASTLQRLPLKDRPPVAAALLSRAEDAADANLPGMVWYGLIPVANADPAALVPLAATGKFPKVRTWIARCLAERMGKQPAPLDALLAATANADEPTRRDVVAGLAAGLAGVRKAAAPVAWKTLAKAFTGPDAERLVQSVRGIEVVFGDGRALAEVRAAALDDKAALDARKAALRAYIEAAPPDLRAVCEKLIKVRFLNAVAVGGLARSDDPAAGKLIAASYQSFHPSERATAVEALASRPSFAAELLELVATGKVLRTDISAFQARRIRGFDNPALTKRLAELWGESRDTPKDKADLIAKLKTELTPAAIAAADRSKGRGVFVQSCAACHRLFGAGGEVGPDLTGAGRKDLDYLLSNVVDPSAVVTKDFQMTTLVLADGRTVNGIVVAETDAGLTVQTEKERVTVPKADVESRKLSALSLMPDGLLQPLSPEQVRNLVAYLVSDTQVDPPAGGP